MIYLVYTFAVIFFAVSFFVLNILSACSNIISLFLQSVEVLSNHLLSDEKKQQKTRAFALKMLKQFVFLLFKMLLVVFAVLSPFYLADHFSLLSVAEGFAFAVRMDVMIATTLVAFFLYLVWKKIFQTENPVVLPEQNYSSMERVMHNLAFGSASLQRNLHKIETSCFSKGWVGASGKAPVFITALPRAGTTVLLETLSRLPTLATHTYRDMPFIFSPVLWSKLSSRFQKKTAMKERAHGDGLLVNEDSPEAFEEVLWLKFFPQKYQHNRISLWQKADENFSAFFHDYMKRIVYLRLPDKLQEARYLSKNNANIARIPVLREMFPDCSIVLPLRDPFEHAASLLRQHLNFQQKHQGESFTQKYMADVGHFEFGELHQPIAFPGLENLIQDFRPEQCDYWLAYWIAAYEYLAAFDDLIIVRYEALCGDSENTLQQLCVKLALTASPEQIKIASALLRHSPAKEQQYQFSEALGGRAQVLYQRLLTR